MDDPIERFTSQEIEQLNCFCKDEWTLTTSDDDQRAWTFCLYNKKELPQQGFKLHISAVPESAVDILRVVVPVLICEKVSFKFSSNILNLINLLNGSAGYTQIGKFITIYPNNDDQCVKLGLKLDKLTRGFIGIGIPFERSIRNNSLVHYRYGAFLTSIMQDDKGEVVNAIRTPDGKLIKDVREDQSDALPWITDPFQRLGVKTKIKKYPTLLKERYLRLKLLGKSSRNLSWVGIDLKDPSTAMVVIKEANHGTITISGKIDTQTTLKVEAEIMNMLQECFFCPKVIEYWSNNDGSYLVYQLIKGITLKSMIKKRSSLGKHIEEGVIRSWGTQLCSILQELHKRQILFLDLKPSNIIIDKNGRINLIDYESAYHPKINNSSIISTQGYRSPQRKKDLHPSIQDDIYSLGAVLFTMGSMIDLSTVPEAWKPALNVDKFCQHVSSRLRNIIKLSLQEDLQERYNTVDKIKHQLRKSAKSENKSKHISKTIIDGSKFLSRAINIGDFICSRAIRDGNSFFWKSQSPISRLAPTRDIYAGNSGIGIFLIDLFHSTKRKKYLYYAQKVACWLQTHEPKIGRQAPLTGLFFGEAGVGLFFLKLYKETNNRKYLRLAIEKSDLISTISHQSPDVMVGASGTGMFHLILFDVTRNELFLRRAVECGRFVVSTAKHELSTCYWMLPKNIYDKDLIYYGFAHGSAGIGYFLIELAKASGEKIFLDMSLNVANSLLRLAQPALNDNSGINWPIGNSDNQFEMYWCHGATGVGLFFLKMLEFTEDKKYLDVLLRAFKTIYQGGTWIGISQCHGLAGSIEFLMDLFLYCKDQKILHAGYVLGDLLLSYKTAYAEGHTQSPDKPSRFIPDYMIGCAGVGASFLRLSKPNLSRSLSREAFR